VNYDYFTCVLTFQRIALTFFLAHADVNHVSSAELFDAILVIN